MRRDENEIKGHFSSEELIPIHEFMETAKVIITSEFPEIKDRLPEADFHWECDCEENKTKKLYFEVKIN